MIYRFIIPQINFIGIFLFLIGNQTTFAQNESLHEINQRAYELRYDNIDSALSLSQYALDVSYDIEDLALKSSILSVRGVLFKIRGDYDRSTKYHLTALEIRQAIKDSIGIAGTLNNIGSNFYLLNQFELAKDYHLKSLKIKEDLKDTLLIISSLNNLGNDYKDLGEIDSALAIYNRGLRLSIDEYDFEAGDFLLNIGVLYNGEKKWLKAIENLRQAASIQNNIEDDFGRAMSLHNLGIAYEGLEIYDSANYYYDQTEFLVNIADDLKLNKDLKRSKLILSLKTGDNDFGLRTFLEYNRLNDSLNAQINDSKINEITSRYDFEKQETEFDLQEEKTKRVQAENDEKYWIIIALLGLLAIIIFSIIFISRFFAQKRRIARLELEGKKQEIARLMHGYELDLFEAQNFGQQEERQRIASDLHDRLGGLLAAVNLQVESLKYKAISDQEEEIARVKAMISDGISEVRNVAHNMRAEALKKHGLKGALEAISKSINASKKVKIDLYLEDLSDTAGSELEREVYKIIMELISNTLRHAKADSITLQINEIDHELTVVFEDDGVGFSYSENQNSGLGMNNIKERVKKLFGSLLVDSQPGSGTTIIIKIPRT